MFCISDDEDPTINIVVSIPPAGTNLTLIWFLYKNDPIICFFSLNIFSGFYLYCFCQSTQGRNLEDIVPPKGSSPKKSSDRKLVNPPIPALLTQTSSFGSFTANLPEIFNYKGAKYAMITVIYKSLGPPDPTQPHLGQLTKMKPVIFWGDFPH